VIDTVRAIPGEINGILGKTLYYSINNYNNLIRAKKFQINPPAIASGFS